MNHRLKAGDVQGLVDLAAGRRVKGGVYIDVAMDAQGKPLEFFLIDPPREVPFEAAKKERIRAASRPVRDPNQPIRRVSLIEAPGETGTMHVVDWVSQHDYPNVADILEEGRRWGFSRRCELTAEEFALLDERSLLILVHAKGSIANWSEYGPLLRPCPKTTVGAGPVPDAHAVWGPPAPPPPTMCAGYWWNDIEAGISLAPGIEPSAKALSRAVNRFQPAGASDPWSYGPVYKAPDGVTPRYVPAMVAWLPIGGFSIVRDDTPAYETRLAELAVSVPPRFPVREVPE